MSHTFGKLLSILGLRYPHEIDVSKYYQGNTKDINCRKNLSTLHQEFLDTEIDIKCCQLPNYKTVLYWLYSFLIFIIICIEPVFLIVKSIQTHDLSYISNISFMIISPIQFLIAMKYFSSKSFDKIFYEVSILKDTKHLIKTDKALVSVILIPSIISCIVSTVFLFIASDDESLYTSTKHGLDIKSLILLAVFQFIYWLYSRSIIFLVLTIFFFVFFKHLNDMKTLIFVVKNNDVWVDDQTIVSEFIHAIIKLRFELNNSIGKLSNIYTISTIIGAIGIGNVIHFKKIDSFTTTSSIIFFMCQAVFLYIIYLITEQQRTMNNIIKHPNFSMKYIYRKYKNLNLGLTPPDKTPFLNSTNRNISTVEANEANEEIQDMSIKSTGRLLTNFYIKSIKSRENENNTLYKLQDENSHRDNVIPLEGLENIRLDDSFELSTYENNLEIANDTDVELGKNINKKFIKIIEENNITIVDDNKSNIKKKKIRKKNKDDITPLTKEIIKKINQISNYNGSSIDYIILHMLIMDNWTSNFDLFGIRFDNSNAIKKAILITGLIATASNFISQIQFFI